MAYARVRHYKVTASDGTHFLEPFTEAQARYFATALESDGVAICPERATKAPCLTR